MKGFIIIVKSQKTDWNGPEAYYDLRTDGQTLSYYQTSGSRFTLGVSVAA